MTIIKHVVNNSGGTSTAGQWTMDVTGSNPSDNHFAGSEAGVVITMNAGSYSVNESGGPSGYAKTLSAGCSGTLAPGASVTCTITNDDIVASLTLTKIVVNNNGGTASPGAWTVSAAGPTPISGAGGATSGSSFAAGAYTLSESSGPAGYSASSWTCTGTGTQNGSQITLQLGQAAACTITNDDIAPSLTLVKIVSTGLGNDPAAPPSAFAIGTTGGPTNISGFGSASSGSTFKAGTYTLGESGLAGYTASGWVCTGQGTQSNNTITLGVGQTAACAITNNLNNIPPVIKVTKTASPKNLTSAGGTVTFTVTVTNQSGYYDPFTLTSLFDNVYGNLADPADAGYKPQDNNTCSLPQTIVPSGSYTCNWQSTFPALDPHVTFSEHDIVIATGTDDDNAGPSSVGTATAEAFVLQAPPIAITDSSLCTFDTNSGLAGKQFNRLFTQDAQSFPHFKLTATNPGQFYWNVNVSGEKGSTVHVKLEVPWPFVTQGNQPIHVYDSVSVVPKPGDNYCFVPGAELQPIGEYIYLKDYNVAFGDSGYSASSPYSSVKTQTIEFDVTIPGTGPGTGYLYINQHLDDGLKGPQVDQNGDGINDYSRYSQGSNSNGLWPATSLIVLPENAEHEFQVYFTGTPTPTPTYANDSIRNDNSFKKDPGVGGLVTSGGVLQIPVVGQHVELHFGSATGPLVGTAITDSEGYYGILYKATGKTAGTYTVVLVGPPHGGPTQTVTLKSNGVAGADFTLP